MVAVYIPYVPPPVMPPPGTTEIAEAAAVAGPDQTLARGTTVRLDVPASHAPGTADDLEWDGETGFIRLSVDKYLEPGVRRQAFLCGPPPMIEAVMRVLDEKGVR